VILETDRLLIREWTFDDAEAMYDMYRRPEVHKYLGPSQPPADFDSYVEFMKLMRERHDSFLPGQGVWAITLKDQGEFIGLAILKTLPNSDKVEIGWHVHPDYQGQGIATEWGHAGLKYGFEVLGLDAIYCILIPENIASRRVAEKIGLRHLGQTTEFFDLTLEFFVATRVQTTP